MDVIRVELDGLIVVRDGAIEVLLEIVGYAAVVEGQGEIRVEPDGLVVVCNGAVGRAHGTVRNAPIVVSIGVIRVEQDGLVEVRDSAVTVTLVVANLGLSQIALS